MLLSASKEVEAIWLQANPVLEMFRVSKIFGFFVYLGFLI